MIGLTHCDIAGLIILHQHMGVGALVFIKVRFSVVEPISGLSV